MKCSRTSFAVSVAAMVVICALINARSNGQVSISTEQEEASSESIRLQSIVEQLRTDYDLPGLSVAIAKTGEEALVATAGFADLEGRIPVAADTGFFIGSVSKNLFAAVVLMLVDQGRMRLDSHLSTYVEWPRGDEVTVKMLLNHTSGIPEYMTGDVFRKSGDGGFPEFFRISRSPRDLIAVLPDREPIFDPGSSQDYSNTNGLLVGEVICEVTDQPLALAFSESIVDPLELQNTYLYGEATVERDRARGYSGAENWGAVDGKLVDCSAADEALPDAADGSIVASAGDLLRYHQALRQGELLSDISWSTMRTVDPGLHNGLGYLITQGPFGRVEGNLGRSMGHTVASVYYLDHELYMVIMFNRSDVPLPLKSFLEPWLVP